MGRDATWLEDQSTEVRRSCTVHHRHWDEGRTDTGRSQLGLYGTKLNLFTNIARRIRP